MKMRKLWAYFIVLSMLLCQNLILPITVNAASGDPLIYYDFGDTTEWSSDDIQPWTDNDHYLKVLTYDSDKRVRVGQNASGRVSFEDYGNYGQVLKMNYSGGASWKELSFYIDDGSGSVFSTKRTLYMKVAYWLTGSDASSSSKIQSAWSYPWSNVTQIKTNTDSIGTEDGWHIYTGTLASSSHGNMTSWGPTLEFTGYVSGSYRIKYLALFDSQEAADAWDPSIQSATYDGNAMTVDNGAHTMSITAGSVKPGTLTAIDGDISITTHCTAVTAVKSGAPTVTETTNNVTVTQNYNVTDLNGDTISWTATVTAPIVAPDEPYLFFDFTTMPNNGSLALGAGTNAANIANYGCDFAKTSTNAVAELACADYNYGGPGLFIRGFYVGYGSNPYTQCLLYSDKFDMTNKKYVRIEYSPHACEANGNNGVGRIIARWEDLPSGNGNEVSYPAGSYPTARQIHTAIVEVDPVNSSNKVLRIGFYNFINAVVVKSVGVFESRAEAEAFDPSLRSVVISGKKAAINGVTHTATVEIADNIAPSAMPTLTSSDITSLVCDNVGATTKNSFVHRAATAAVVAGSQEITEDLTSVMSSISYTVTDKTGTAHTWKMIAKSKKNGMAANQVSEQYYIYDFTNVETVQAAISDGIITARDGNLSDMYPANVSLTSSALHAVKDSGGRVGLEIDFPNDEVRHRWYAKTLLSYDGAVNGNVQIHWTRNWSTTGKDSVTGADRTYVTLDAEQWKTVSTDLSLAATAQPLGLYSGAGQDMNFKYIALFGTAADRDAFDPSVVSAKITANGRTYLASVDNIAHTVTFPTGCGDADDLDAAVLTLYNGSTGITAVPDGAATVTQNFTGAPYELKKTYTVTGLDGTTATWTAIIPFTTAVTFTSAGDTVTATFADQLSKMMNCIAFYQTENNVLYFAANNSGEGALSADTSSFASGTYTLKAFSFYDNIDFLPVIKEQTQTVVK